MDRPPDAAENVIVRTSPTFILPRSAPTGSGFPGLGPTLESLHPARTSATAIRPILRLRVRCNARSAGDKHRDSKCKKRSLCQGPAGEELNDFVHRNVRDQAG